MKSVRFSGGPWSLLAATVLSLPVLLAVPAAASDKKSAPAPHPSAPAHPASAPKPAGGGGGAAGHPGGSGPSTGHPGGANTNASHGPTTSNPGHGPTTSSPGHTTTTAGGNHPTTTTGGGNHPGTPGVHNTSQPGGAHGNAGGGNRTATGHPAPTGSHTVNTKSGGAVTRRANGKVSDVHDAKRNMDIHHNLAGGKRVSVERADHSRVVAERGRRGYIERRYSYHGHDFERRSYYWHGHEYPRYYRGYYYGGVYMNVYAPGFYYAPAFYGWAYNPWYAPVPYAWGWAPNPWYGYYGFYFNPYPVYAAPAFWLTDYLIAAELQAAFAARAAAAAEGENVPPSLYLCERTGCGTLAHNGDRFSGTLSDGTQLNLSIDEWNSKSVLLTRLDSDGKAVPGAVTYSGAMMTPTMVGGTASGASEGDHAWTASANAPILMASNGGAYFADAAGAPKLTPEIKQMVSDEVKGQIALENSEAQQNAQGQDADPASSGIQRLMSDGKSHVFVAGDALDVTDDGGNECALSDGDVLQMTAAPAADSTDAKLTVLASKGDKECATSSSVTVQVSDLQEMQNHLRETIDQGMQELKDKQGTNGLPAAPASAKAEPTQTAYAQNAPPAEKDGEQAVNEQLSESDQADKQAEQESPGDGSAAPAQTASAAPAPSTAQPVSIEVGQTIDQVTSSLGQPLSIIDLGAKKIYKYKDMKITFKAGKVSDVE